jgi:hypothetical protein
VTVIQEHTQLTAADDGHKSQNSRDQQGGKKTTDGTLCRRWKLVDETKRREILREVVDIGK